MDAYTTVSGFAQAEYIEKRSRFIGGIWPVETEEQAAAVIAQTRAKYWDASHNCHAYILRSGTQRYNDDGEPQGTAGMPILEVLRRETVTDALVIVTRYFGGTLLGAGGLVRAYSHTAKLALNAAGKRVMQPCALVRVTVPYALYNRIGALFENHAALILDSVFGEAVTLELRLPAKNLPAFTLELTELSGGSVVPEVTAEIFA